jgi:hypothetical protein
MMNLAFHPRKKIARLLMYVTIRKTAISDPEIVDGSKHFKT